MKLVGDWRSAWRWWSVRGSLLIAAIYPTWISLPPDIKAMIPPEWGPWVFTVVGVATALGRVIPQDQGTKE